MNSTTEATVSSHDEAAREVAIDQAQTGTCQGYLPVDVALLKAEPRRAFDLYQRADRQRVLFCAKDFPLTGKALRRLKAEDEITLHVPIHQGPMVSQYAEGVLRQVMQDEQLVVQRRANILHTSARTIMADVLANPTAEGVVRRGVGLANATVDFMTKNPAALKSMVALFTKDYYTYTHSVHTCVFGVAMYKYLLSPKIELLRRFGLGMLLHDTGKSLVDQAVLNKPARLTEDEFEHMQSHAVVGWETLKSQGVKDDLVQQVVLRHHERLDGNGYPGGLSGGQISEAVRVAGIVDVYDALTTDRPYRTAMSHKVAVGIMREEMVPDHLDGDFLAAFEKVSRTVVSHSGEGSDIEARGATGR